MSDDRPYGQKQADHAAKIKAERAVMDMTGASRSQIRAKFAGELADFAKRTSKAQEVQGPPRPSPEVKVTRSGFPGSGNSLPQGSDGTGAPAEPSSALNDIIVILNGTAYYTNLLTDGRLEEVV